MMESREELMRLRAEYEALCDKRLAEMGLPEEFKTIKTEDFVERERRLLHKCAKEKERIGIIVEKPGKSYNKGRVTNGTPNDSE